MKQLILVRHGKSSWDYGVGDKDRPLQERGIKDATLVASHFGALAPPIDMVYSSPAIRALHTCTIFLRSLDYPMGKLRLTEVLYDFSGENVIKFVKGLDNIYETVMIFGHNNAFTEVANLWGNQSIGNVPTSGLVHLKFGTNDWNTVDNGTTEHTLFPKQLK